MRVRVCVRVLAHQKFPRNIIYIHLRGRTRTDETRTRGRSADDRYYIYKYHYYRVRVRVSVAHFSCDIMRLCWRVLACRACAMVCMYIDIDIVCSACGSCFRFGLQLVCCWFVSARVVSCYVCAVVCRYMVYSCCSAL